MGGLCQVVAQTFRRKMRQGTPFPVLLGEKKGGLSTSIELIVIIDWKRKLEQAHVPVVSGS